jgi:hypothetical protein
MSVNASISCTFCENVYLERVQCSSKTVVHSILIRYPFFNPILLLQGHGTCEIQLVAICK